MSLLLLSVKTFELSAKGENGEFHQISSFHHLHS